MKLAHRWIKGWFIILLFGCLLDNVRAATQAAQFVGSTPGDLWVREFLGGLPTNASCHSVIWQLTFATNEQTGTPTTFSLTGQYRVPTRANPNRSEDGPKIALQGNWELLNGVHQPASVVYRLSAANRSLSLVRLTESLLHVLDTDGKLAIGNGGESYTLNRTDHAEKPGDMAAAVSAPDMSYKISALSTGATVFAVFEGRSPCHGIARELKSPQHAGCIKAKWRVTLYQNPETKTPTTYKVEGSLYRKGAREGTWIMGRGTKTNPNATVYELGPTATQPAILLLKGSDDVLFFLNHDREPMVGHAEFSYTLNRVTKK